jgi:DNA-binding NarL/FixJ family response regulator
VDYRFREINPAFERQTGLLIGMPYVNGRQVSTAVKAKAPGTLVIMLTGWGQRFVADGGTPLHVDTVLSKPPKLRELRQALAQGLKAEQS